MQPTWLIEEGVYAGEADALLAEIRRQGMVGAEIPHAAIAGAGLSGAGQPLPSDACVIGYGTYPFARQIQLHRRWTPGAWCEPQNLDCSVWFAYFGQFLLNQQYVIMPGVEAIRQRDWLFSVFAKNNEVFARPTGCQKLFVGRRISRTAFAEALAPTRYDPATLVVIASPKEIDCEWRLVIIGERIIAASQYARHGEPAPAAECPAEVRAFAASMLAAVPWRPDAIFMMDVCAAQGRLWLVELNAFSTSWLYACDLPSVVAEASRLAVEQWQRR